MKPSFGGETFSFLKRLNVISASKICMCHWTADNNYHASYSGHLLINQNIPEFLQLFFFSFPTKRPHRFIIRVLEANHDFCGSYVKIPLLSGGLFYC